jgi:flavorubredoxin
MTDTFRAVQVSEHVYWVGAIDWTVRNFHGYLTGRGTTYNAYLILADKIALVDTVKKPFTGELLERVASVIDPRRIAYIISNHSEMDHSGGLPAVIEAVRPDKVFASANGARALRDNLHMDHQITVVKDDQQLSLGNVDVTFLMTPMVHWPDSMISYLGQDKVLFSQDGFGMHVASSERFADELDQDVVTQEFAKYYANILLPYPGPMAKILAKLAGLNLPLAMIAPDHGPIWRKDLGGLPARYAKWAAREPTRKAVVVFDTMWHSTELMARAVGEGLAAGGAVAKLMRLDVSHRSDVASELLEAGALLVGSPTLNNNVFPTVADVMTYLRGLRPANLIGAAFGSYGWNDTVTQQLNDMLAEMKVEIVSEPLSVKYVPDKQDLARCRQLGELVANRLKQVCKG